MDQSGPRHPVLKSPLIERPDLQSPRQRTLYGALTLSFWAFWIYLWLPVLALLAWVLGVQQAYKYMVVLGGYVDVLRLAGFYGVVILLLGGGLAVWATYNIARYGDVEHRRQAHPVELAEIVRYFGQEEASVTRWHNERRLYVMHDADGRISHVEVLAEDGQAPS